MYDIFVCVPSCVEFQIFPKNEDWVGGGWTSKLFAFLFQNSPSWSIKKKIYSEILEIKITKEIFKVMYCQKECWNSYKIGWITTYIHDAFDLKILRLVFIFCENKYLKI